MCLLLLALTGVSAADSRLTVGAANNADAPPAKVPAGPEPGGSPTRKEPQTGPRAGEKFENSLGMKFVPVPGTTVLFCIWKTRVKDFEAFVDATQFNATKGLWTVGPGGWQQLGGSWKEPGFAQTPLHPVCGVSFEDAQAFCLWLTVRERKADRIGPRQSYRLPTDAEWSAAVGGDKFPWGDAWPPPPGAGNYADESSDVKPKIDGYRDGYNRTSPVGAFRENRFGLYDLGGNLWEWCDDWYRADMNSDETKKESPDMADDQGGQTFRVLRGAAWINNTPAYLASGCRGFGRPSVRYDGRGFRVVLVTGADSR